MQELRDRVAVITGAGSGIGAGLARRCAAEGMRVVLADVERGAVEGVASELRRGGARAEAVVVDVRDAAALERLAAHTWETFGGCHLLVNNAGVVAYRPIAELEISDWRWVLSVNLDGVIHGLGIAHYFDTIVSGLDVAQVKPAPDIFLEAARRLGVAPAECAVLEDAEKGVLAAHAAGMHCLAVPNDFTHHHDFSKATRVCASLHEVTIDLLQNLGAKA